MIAEISTNDQFITLVDKKSKNEFHLLLLNLLELKILLKFDYKYYRKECWPLIRFNQYDEIAYRISS